MGNLLGITSDGECSVWEKVDALRQQASYEHDAMVNCFEQSQLAYHKQQHALAKQLSVEGKEHKQRMVHANEHASNLSFDTNNADGVLPKYTIDVHRLKLNEAITRVETHVKIAKARGDPHLIVITGAGLHSPNQIPVLKPHIEKLMKEHGLGCRPDVNKGRLIVTWGEEKGWLVAVGDAVLWTGSAAWRSCSIM